MEQIKKAAIYCRTAVMDNFAVEKQEAELTNLATEQGYEQPSVFIDNGVSGARYTRPAFDKLNGAIDGGAVHTVFIHDISRIGRSFMQTEKWIRGIHSKGVALISVCEGELQGGFIYGA